MASDETMMTFQSSLQDEDFEDDIDDGFDDHHSLNHPHHPHNLSRLSVCTSSTLCGVDDDVDVDVENLASMCMSHLSIESFEGDGEDADADVEFSDGGGKGLLSSGSENELGSCYSLPATPPRRRNNINRGHHEMTPIGVAKEYASDNEARKRAKNNDPSRRTRMRRERRGWENSILDQKKDKGKGKEEEEGGISGESDESTGGGGSTGTGVMVITRPKGGKRPLCMDLEEVKACRDLGFELEHERMLEIPSRLSFSNSTLDTSSGGNSPIANWRISSPGMLLPLLLCLFYVPASASAPQTYMNQLTSSVVTTISLSY